VLRRAHDSQPPSRACQTRDVRADVLGRIAGLVPERPHGFVRVGVDGVDGAGKTTFADALGEHLSAEGREVVRVRADDFLHPRALRHRRGRDSPEGFFRDSYDLDRLHLDVLDPFAPLGSGRHRLAALDLEADTPLEPPWQQAAAGSVLVLDGMFLHRDDLVGTWDVSVLLDVPFAETARRMAVRDGSDPDPHHPTMRRYVEGQQLYFRLCDPRERADVVVDNTDPHAPRIVTAPS
jgi:uridine kinase